jgi:hypothetical protein
MANCQDQKAGNGLQDNIEIRIAIGAATAANCIPCFEHLYEKAVNAGVPLDDIKRASEIAGLVKTGAHSALTASINELIDNDESQPSTCCEGGERSCC